MIGDAPSLAYQVPSRRGKPRPAWRMLSQRRKRPAEYLWFTARLAINTLCLRVLVQHSQDYPTDDAIGPFSKLRIVDSRTRNS